MSTALPAATLAECAEAVLRTQDPWRKAALSRSVAAHWLEGETGMAVGQSSPPSEPARPGAPELLDPRKMPKRGFGGPRGRAALIHAISHIELNAIDLHWDIIARFAHEPMPPSFYDDWALAASQEAKHFQLLTARLSEMGFTYGDFPAHAGLWRSASATAEDLLGRLAVVPMVLEARGLDVTPGMIAQFREIEDLETVAALEVIYAEEVAHVAYGSKWFHFLCGRKNTDPRDAFHELVRLYFSGSLKPPFNEEKRAEAGLPPDFYWPLVETSPTKQ
ncbi:MAG: ferritin-like domain-containing protein [Rhodobacteraceae bacterium]|nr:ferritin-like domain-containing protein [Paracoccaceae bacterium]